MEKLSDFARLVDQAANGHLVFPSSVNGALRLQQALADPDVHIKDVCRMVLAEPLLAARAVALANSPVFARTNANLVTGARAAVDRLGYRNLYSLATAMVVRQFGNRIRDPRLRSQARQLWEHSAHVAALAHEVAAKVTRIDADTAMFAGIVHETGGLYLLSQADLMPDLLEQIGDWMGPAQEIITRALMKKLAIPEPVSTAIVALPGSRVTLPPAGLRDTLLIAKMLAPVASPIRVDHDSQSQADALSFYLDDHAPLRELLDSAARDARELSSALLV